MAHPSSSDDIEYPFPVHKVVDLLRAHGGGPLHLREIRHELNVRPDDRKDLRTALAMAVEAGVLERTDQGRGFRLPITHDVVEGVVWRHEKGYGWLTGTGVGGGGKGNDPFISPDQMESVLHGDRVRAKVIPQGGGRTRAVILEVVGKPRYVVGVLRKRGRHTAVELEETGEQLHVSEGPVESCADGSAVEVLISERPSTYRMGICRLIRALGRPGDLKVEIEKVLINAQIPMVFSELAQEEANDVNDAIEAVAAADPDRRDITHLPLVTIDGPTAKDFDDAVCVERHGSKHVLTVAIADVSFYVRPGSVLDREACERGTSVYIPGRVIPMLPPRLSDTLCSLRPHEPRLCMVAQMTFGHGPRPEKVDLFAGLMRSRARLTYERVAEAMNAGLDALPEAKGFDLKAAADLYRKLHSARLARGALDLDLPEIEVDLGDDGEPLDLHLSARHDSHRLIEEFMLAANEAVASWFAEREQPCVYRIHEDPDAEKLDRFRVLANAHAIEVRLPPEPTPTQLGRFLEALKDHPAARPLQTVLLRSMMQARYEVVNAGHYGLASEAYLHFTSPIRRYPDLLVHRQLRALLQGAARKTPHAHDLLPHDEPALAVMAQSSTRTERKAQEIERDVHALYAAHICARHIGEEFDGVIMGCEEFGLFVHLSELNADGMIPVASLGPERFELDPHKMMLAAPRSGRTFRLGQDVRVRIVDASLQRKRVTLGLAEGVVGAGVPEEEELETTRARSARVSPWRRPEAEEKPPRRRVAAGTHKKAGPRGKPGRGTARPGPRGKSTGGARKGGGRKRR
ncbi:MAG: ribonuclease R [Myxococcota bacterium]